MGCRVDPAELQQMIGGLLKGPPQPGFELGPCLGGPQLRDVVFARAQGVGADQLIAGWLSHNEPARYKMVLIELVGGARVRALRPTSNGP